MVPDLPFERKCEVATEGIAVALDECLEQRNAVRSGVGQVDPCVAPEVRVVPRSHASVETFVVKISNGVGHVELRGRLDWIGRVDNPLHQVIDKALVGNSIDGLIAFPVVHDVMSKRVDNRVHVGVAIFEPVRRQGGGDPRPDIIGWEPAAGGVGEGGQQLFGRPLATVAVDVEVGRSNIVLKSTGH